MGRETEIKRDSVNTHTFSHLFFASRSRGDTSKISHSLKANRQQQFRRGEGSGKRVAEHGEFNFEDVCPRNERERWSPWITRRLSRYVAVKGWRVPRRKRSPNRPTIDSLPCKAVRSIQRGRKETGRAGWKDSPVSKFGSRRGQEWRWRNRGRVICSGVSKADSRELFFVYNLHAAFYRGIYYYYDAISDNKWASILIHRKNALLPGNLSCVK